MVREVLRFAGRQRRLLLSLLVCLSVQMSFAQMGKLFDANHQLSSNFTNQVYIDNDGFLWAVTRNGLNRYDGYQFHIYKKDARQENGMASNYVNCMTQDKTGRFYLGMWGVLQTYDGNQFKTIEVSGLTGTMTWNEDGSVTKTPKAVVIKGGVYVSPENL